MKKILKITSICSALVMTLAVAAYAGPDAGGKGQGDGKGKGPGGAGGPRINPEKIYTHLNADGSEDGISLEEYQAGPMAKRAKDPSMVEERFKKLDADNSGSISKQELVDGMKKMRGGRPGGPGGPDKGKGKGKPGKGKGDNAEAGKSETL